MTDGRPDPLVPAEVDLRDYQFMPLDVVRLRDSRIVDEVTGDEFRAAVLLWCSAWHQVPAGSLPDDDAQLAKFAGYGRVIKEWLRRKAGALHGFVLCNDGRLYHPVIAEKAIDAWAGRRSASSRGKIGAKKRWHTVDGTATNDDDKTDGSAILKNSSAIKSNGSAIPLAIEKHSNGEGEDREKDKVRARARGGVVSNAHPNDNFAAFWSTYPKQVDRRSAERSFAKALTRADASTILAGAKLYAQERKHEDPHFTKHPDNWLDLDSWTEFGPKVHLLTPEQDAAARDKADRLLKRGKYAEQTQ